MLLGFLGAVALAAQEPAPPIEDDPDLRCMVAVSILLNHMAEDAEANEEETAGVMAIFMYYVGKIDGRMPGFNYADAVRKLIEGPDYAAKMIADFRRCGAEAQKRGQSLMDLGKELESTAPLVDSKPG